MKICHSSKTKSITNMKRLSWIYSQYYTKQRWTTKEKPLYWLYDKCKLIYMLILYPTELHILAPAVNTIDLLPHITDNVSCHDIT